MQETLEIALIRQIIQRHGLGNLMSVPVRVSGGFLHRMYRAETDRGCFAVKLLNPEIMKRPDAASNFDRAERLERVLEARGLPVVAALEWDGQKRQREQGREYYVFPWAEGSPAPWDGITASQCARIGELLARIHRLEQRNEASAFEPMDSPWETYAARARRECPEIYDGLQSALGTLRHGQELLNEAQIRLSPVTCIVNDDMDPKNVLWAGNEPRIIDLECLDYGHPFASAFQLALQWCGGVTYDLSPDRLGAFLTAYRRAYGPVPVRWETLYGLGFVDLGWLEYNIRRAFGEECTGEEDRRLGIDQVKVTLKRFLYYASLEDCFPDYVSGVPE